MVNEYNPLMEIVLYIYFAINLFIAGMSVDVFNTKRENIRNVSILLFFGTILLLWEFTLADKFEEWFNNSSFGFYWKLYLIKKYDNLDSDALEYIRGQILAENKDKQSQKSVKHLTKILKRNE